MLNAQCLILHSKYSSFKIFFIQKDSSFFILHLKRFFIQKNSSFKRFLILHFNTYLCNMKRIKPIYYIIAVLAALIIAGVVMYKKLMSPLSKQAQTEYIYIDTDDDIDSVMNQLRGISAEYPLWLFDKIANHYEYPKKIRTGRYAITTAENAIDVFRKLRGGMQTAISLRLPEVRTVEKLATALSDQIMLDSATLAKAFTDSAFCTKYGYKEETLTALFIPNTYEVYWDISLEKFMERMVKENQRFWNETRMKKAEAQGLTPVEVAILASIIDEETRNNGEKPMIAGMYLNRLKIKMPLQADPTIKFAMQAFKLRRILNSMLKTKSPYNTYTNVGLPPGPIKIASIASLEAVLNPASHKYLYMCAKEDFSGTHNFARTYSEHLKNASRYRKALNARNIK
jgi:UPF0755 protein